MIAKVVGLEPIKEEPGNYWVYFSLLDTTEIGGSWQKGAALESKTFPEIYPTGPFSHQPEALLRSKANLNMAPAERRVRKKVEEDLRAKAQKDWPGIGIFLDDIIKVVRGEA
ncbi:hypothetical protein ACWIG4_30365 [Streptomyces sp. NPDC002248]